MSVVKKNQNYSKLKKPEGFLKKKKVYSVLQIVVDAKDFGKPFEFVLERKHLEILELKNQRQHISKSF